MRTTVSPDSVDGEDEQPARNSDFVQPLDRGLAVIRAFGPDREHLSLSEVAQATGLTRAAARRFR
jgi:IclR family pca regulon transcriptional regulator